MTSKVVSQGHCEYCNSSDAYTEYADGGAHCFSCNFHQRSTTLPWEMKVKETPTYSGIIPASDLCNEFPNECVDWLAHYHITVSDLIKHGVKWSPSYQQLTFIYKKYEDPSQIGVIQSRNFASNSMRKYYNIGEVNEVLPIYKAPLTAPTRLIIVEDAISAIKLSRFECAMPVLGSHISFPKIRAIKALGYKEITVWLDHDKYGNALRIQKQFKLIGLACNIIKTDLDPKCYDYFALEYKLDEGSVTV